MTKRIKTVIALTVALAVIISSAVFAPDIRYDNPAEVPDTYYSDLTSIIAKYDKHVSKEEAESNPYALSRLVVTGWDGKKHGAAATAYDKKNDLAVLQYSSPEKAESARAELLSSGMTAEPDTLLYLDDAQSCVMSPQHSGALGIPTYIDNFAMQKDNVTVAVIDTGVMFDHSAISSRFISEGVDLSGDNMLNAYYDVEERGEHYGHGTSVCGVIADNTPSNVKIMPVKVVPFGTDYAASSVIASAMNYAIDNGANVISISVSGTGYVQSYTKAMNKALSKGVCVCVSAGNSSQEITERYPACIDGAITVSALDSTNEQIASYSNYGSVIDFCAPGYKINSTYPQNGESTYKTVSGTSYSTPFIAALCADIKSIDVSMSKENVYQSLCDFAVDLGDAGKDIYYGNGMPYVGNMIYSGEEYNYQIPQGILNVTASRDYAENERPWERYASKMEQVNISSSINRIGDYSFCNMENAVFTLPEFIRYIGDYAFTSCKRLTQITFDANIISIGYKAFSDIENLTITGYDDTPAETYALSENINFNSLGCNHKYFREAFAPPGEEPYILCICSVCGNETREPYTAPQIVASGACGENVNYKVDSLGRITIYGSGDMYDYTSTRPPWYNRRSTLKVLEIEQGVTKVTPLAFLGCDSILKVYVSPDSATYSSDGASLLSKSGDELVLTFAHGRYRLPDTVESLSAPAFVAANSIALEVNSNFRMEDFIIYDSENNIAAALPNYRGRTLTVNTPGEIKPYAFILCDYPVRLESGVVDLTVGEYGIGYKFDFMLKKHALTVKACAENGAVAYATQNGFDIETDLYRCGENLTYYYNSEYNQLNIGGAGEMTEYAAAEDVPWYGYMEDITIVNIGDNVSALSSNAFNGAAGIDYLTMPLSLEAPDATVWSGCNQIKHLTLTLGTGIMDDYTDSGNALFYQNSPWFISRATITDLSLDSRVKYIGKQAFRGCSAITHVSLDCVEEIAEDAFIACAKLSDVTIRSKNAVLTDYCLFSYMTNTRKIYPRSKLTAYCDSTAKDYCDRLGVTLIPLGCGHSRDVTLLSEQSDGLTLTSTYLCNDCGEEFNTYEDISLTLTGTVVSTTGVPVENAEITVNGTTVQCNENGEFTVNHAPCGNVEITVSVNGAEQFSQTVNISGEICSVTVTLRYADYVTDGVINAKDYAFALKHGYNDTALFDYGRIQNGNNVIEVNDEN